MSRKHKKDIPYSKHMLRNNCYFCQLKGFQKKQFVLIALIIFIFFTGCIQSSHETNMETNVPSTTINEKKDTNPFKNAQSQLATTLTPTPSYPNSIRKSILAGSWYSASKATLEKNIKSYFEKAQPTDLNNESLIAIAVPHAGHIYSGTVAAHSFKHIKKGQFKTVVLIGPSHHHYFTGVSVNNAQNYETPLGVAYTNLDLANTLIEQNKWISYVPDAHKKEHSLEIQIPFIQYIDPDLRIVIMVMGAQTRQNVDIVANALFNVLKDRNDVLVLASTDYSHFFNEQQAHTLDQTCIDHILQKDVKGLMSSLGDKTCQMCGGGPCAAVLSYGLKKGVTNVYLEKYATSADVTGDSSNVVGYAAFSMTAPPPTTTPKPEPKEKELVSKDEKHFLLQLARKRVDSIVKGTIFTEPDTSQLTPIMKEKMGCFVTLHKYGDLRGCIGYILPKDPLYKCVIANAINACQNDMRFTPVKPNELENIDVEISVLTVPKKLEYSDPQDLLNKLRPGIDGVIVKSGWHQSTYLPQVWEQLPDKEDFLSRLCSKSGASKNCWKSKSTTIEIYQAIVFSEKDLA